MQKKLFIVSEPQANRLWAIARDKNHRFRPWQAIELQKLMKYHGCIDASGKPSHYVIPIYKNGVRFYEELCKVVAGPVPEYCLEEEPGNQLRLV